MFLFLKNGKLSVSLSLCAFPQHGILYTVVFVYCLFCFWSFIPVFTTLFYIVSVHVIHKWNLLHEKASLQTKIHLNLRLKLSSLLNYFLFKQFHFSSLRVSYVVLFGVNGKRGVLLGKHVPLTCIT